MKFYFITACAGYKIRVGCKECNKGSHKAQGPYHTYYYAQNDQKGGNTWYKTSDGKYAIWYDSNRGSWNIGNAIDVDTDSRGAHGISNANCPYNKTISNWRYYDGVDKKWYDAGKTLTVDLERLN